MKIFVGVIICLLFALGTACAGTLTDNFGSLDCNGWIQVGASPAPDCSSGQLRCPGVCSDSMVVMSTIANVTYPVSTTYSWIRNSGESIYSSIYLADSLNSNNIHVILHYPIGVRITDSTNKVTECSYDFSALKAYTINIQVNEGGQVSVSVDGVPACSSTTSLYLPGLSHIFLQDGRHDDIIDDFSITHGQSCSPDWSCSGYASCTSDPYLHEGCLSVADLNGCGQEFTGDLADYDIAPCDAGNETGNHAGETYTRAEVNAMINAMNAKLESYRQRCQGFDDWKQAADNRIEHLENNQTRFMDIIGAIQSGLGNVLWRVSQLENRSQGSCTEDWHCNEWGSCQLNLQLRMCSDLNQCGTTASKPKEMQPCNATQNNTIQKQVIFRTNVLNGNYLTQKGSWIAADCDGDGVLTGYGSFSKIVSNIEGPSMPKGVTPEGYPYNCYSSNREVWIKVSGSTKMIYRSTSVPSSVPELSSQPKEPFATQKQEVYS